MTITNAAAVSAGSGQGWPQVGALLLAFGFLGGGSAAAAARQTRRAINAVDLAYFASSSCGSCPP
ncbi:MAG: hypothetical protein JO296_17015 [Pseudonocardiales bacterium]|nr:hypothetical protein [Pseudonocardiales bacterium]MBV9651817.1 hypothetical protein [Pseudonocardiales bacterium]